MVSHAVDLDRLIIINKPNIPRSRTIIPHKILIPWRTLAPRIARQHALDRHAHTLHVLYWAPATRGASMPGGGEQVQADVPIAIDVWVNWYWAWWGGEEDECYFWRFCLSC